jgi:hypothetical protein
MGAWGAYKIATGGFTSGDGSSGGNEDPPWWFIILAVVIAGGFLAWLCWILFA